MSLTLSQPPAVPLKQHELSPEILAIVNNRRITEHSAMIWNIPATQTIYSVVAAFQEACGEIVGVGAMHDMREDPTLKCIRASFATPYYLQIALNLSGTLWGGSKLLIRKYKGPNHGKTNSNLLLAQNGFNLNGINNMPASLSNMTMTDINKHQSSQSTNNIGAGINTLVNNGAINAGRGSNKTVAQQIFQHLDMQQLAYLMLVQQHITQQNQFDAQEERRKKGIDESSSESDSDSDTDSDSDSDDGSDEEVDNEQTNKNLNRTTKRKRSRSRERSRSSRRYSRERSRRKKRKRSESVDKEVDNGKKEKAEDDKVKKEEEMKADGSENGIEKKEEDKIEDDKKPIEKKEKKKKRRDKKSDKRRDRYYDDEDDDYYYRDRDKRSRRDRRGSRRRRYRSYSYSRSRSRSRGRY